MYEDFVDSHGEKLNELDKYFRENEWKEYQTLVHSMKSSSKIIGADELSGMARELEMAAGEKKINFIENHQEAFVKKYKEICENN